VDADGSSSCSTGWNIDDERSGFGGPRGAG
jgi:hypothetical protein